MYICMYEPDILESMHFSLHAYELTAIKNMMRSTGIHTFLIIGICPCTNIPAKLHLLVPLHSYCRLHIDPTLLYIWGKKQQNCNSYLPCYCHLYAKNKYAPQMPHMPFSSCADTRELYQNICLIWPHCNQQCDNEHWYTWISHCWHMPLYMYAFHITQICFTALIM